MFNYNYIKIIKIYYIQLKTIIFLSKLFFFYNYYKLFYFSYQIFLKNLIE